MRLDRVFSWLADHLDDTLDLERLAEVACMSPYHFHRIYHAMQGETAADTVRRLRLHRAAVELITGELPVPAHRSPRGIRQPGSIHACVQNGLWCATGTLSGFVRSTTNGKNDGGCDGHDDDLSGDDTRDTGDSSRGAGASR